MSVTVKQAAADEGTAADAVHRGLEQAWRKRSARRDKARLVAVARAERPRRFAAVRRLAVTSLLLMMACSTAPISSPIPTPGAAEQPTPTITTRPTEVVAPNPAHEPAPFPLDATIPELQEAMEAGRLTSVELVDFYLARIAAYDEAGPELNAFIFVNHAARDEAAALDAERADSGPRGLLHGIPIVLKDNLNTADMPTTAGASMLAGFVPGEDAFQVRQLREAGAVILGKTNLFTFARGWETKSELVGQTLNPYDLNRDPGGSSGGTAVAVSANLAVVGLGTDTCGSIRLPAANTNLYGLRPTSGLSSRSGVVPLSSTLDTVGPIARSVVDLAIVLDVTAGEDPADPTTMPIDTSFFAAVTTDGLEGRRIGVVSMPTSAVMETALAAALDELAMNGAELIEVSLPREPSGASLGYFVDEFQAAFSDYLAGYPDAPVQPRAVPPRDPEVHRRAIEARDTFRAEVVALMDEHDLDAIAYAASAEPAATIGAGSQTPYDCYSAALGGLPALVVPAGFTAEGLPVGLELMARPFGETVLIALAAGYEANTSHRMLPPTTPPLDLTR